MNIELSTAKMKRTAKMRNATPIILLIQLAALQFMGVFGQSCNANDFVVSNGQQVLLKISSTTEVEACGVNLCEQVTNGLQTLSLTSDGKIGISNGNDIALPDNSPTNELQTITINGEILTLSNGGTVNLPDASSTNELQTLTINGETLSLSSGGTVTLPDASSTNELQTLAINGGTLTLSQGGGTVPLPDASATNELQTLAITSGGTLSISSTNSVQLPDSDSSNEIQTLSIDGRTVSLSRNGGSITLPNFYRGFSVLTMDSTIKANWVNVIFERVEWNSWPSAYNNVTGSFTVPVSGAYEFAVNGWWNTVTNGPDVRYVLYYKINGIVSARYGGGQLSAGATIMSTFSEVKILSAGDIVQVAVYTTIDISVARYWWQAKYLGPLFVDN